MVYINSLPVTYVNSLLMNYLICKQLRNIVYMGVLNTALYYTKVCLGFSFKHTQVDIPKLLNIDYTYDYNKSVTKITAVIVEGYRFEIDKI